MQDRVMIAIIDSHMIGSLFIGYIGFEGLKILEILGQSGGKLAEWR